MNNESFRRPLGLLVLSSLFAACSRDVEAGDLPGQAEKSGPAAVDGTQTGATRATSPALDFALADPVDRERMAARFAEIKRVGRYVPHALLGSECTNAEPLDTCTWAGATDAVVVGTVRAVRLTDTPVAGPAQDAEWKWYQTCSVTRPALEIDLDVEHDFAGKISGSVTVHVGKRQVDILSPSPYRGADGSLRWAGSADGDNPLAEGQRVLVGLHYVKDLAAWSLMGEMISGIDAEGTVHVPRAGCMHRGPVALDQTTLSHASATLESCLAIPPSAAALALGTQRRQTWGDEKLKGSGANPASYVAAECMQPDFQIPADPEQ
jgi:hypothetical protein